jgi:hypothetical protein
MWLVSPQSSLGSTCDRPALDVRKTCNFTTTCRRNVKSHRYRLAGTFLPQLRDLWDFRDAYLDSRDGRRAGREFICRTAAHRFPVVPQTKRSISVRSAPRIVIAGYCASRTFFACWSLPSSRSSRASSLRIRATFSSCLPICSRTISTGVFLTHGFRLEGDVEVDGVACVAVGVPAEVIFCTGRMN